MTASVSIARILTRYGSQIVRCRTGEVPVDGRGMIQPVLDKAQGRGQVVPTPLGAADDSRFLYLGEPGLDVRQGDRLGCREEWFWVRRAKAVWVGNCRTHWWAVLTRGEEESV